MTTTTELFARLNTLRVANSLKPLKAWKESKAKLEAAIAKLAEEVEGIAELNDPVKAFIAKNGVTKCPPAKALLEAQKHREAVDDAAEKLLKGEAPAPKRAAAVRVHVDGGSITLVQIASELRINPKIARAKMRRIDVPAEYLIAKHVYKREHKQAIVDLLKSDLRKVKKD